VERVNFIEISNIKHCNRKEELKKFMLYSLPVEFKVLLFNCYNCVQGKFFRSQCPKISISDFLIPLCSAFPKVSDLIIIHSATGGKFGV